MGMLVDHKFDIDPIARGISGRFSACKPDSAARFDQHWSSDGLDARAALAEANHLFNERIVEADIIPSRESSYHYDWRSHRLVRIDLNFLRTAPQRVKRTRSMVAKSSRHSFVIMLVHLGGGTCSYRNRSTALKAGDYLIIDSDEPWELSFDVESECLTVRVEAEWLSEWLPQVGDLLMQPLGPDRHWSLPLSALLELLAEHGPAAAPMGRGALEDQFGRLLNLAFGIRRMGGALPGAEGVRTKIRELIECDCSDPFLTATSAASKLGMSRRYLHKVLANNGEHFRKILELARLEQARKLLTSPLHAKESIGEIAWKCGFSDQGYFARRFSANFNVKPSEFRRDNLYGSALMS
jgi:AraC-like DNA-binding protein